MSKIEPIRVSFIETEQWSKPGKSAQKGYRDKANGIKSIQHNSSQDRSKNAPNITNEFEKNIKANPITFSPQSFSPSHKDS